MKNVITNFSILLIIIVFTLSCSTGPVEKASAVPQVSPLAAKAGAKTTAESGFKSSWQETLAAAKKEGKVVIFGPPGADVRTAATRDFKKAIPGIEVEYLGAPGAAQIPRLKAERRASIFNVDIFWAGTSTLTPDLLEDALPIKDFLILPEVTDIKYWMGGSLDFADKAGKYNLVFSTFAKPAMVYNPKLMEPSKLKELSYWEFVKPEWKGKLIMRDPRTVGPGNASATFFYDHRQLGPDFLKSLAKNLVLTRDDRTLLEGVSRGKYVAGFGQSDLLLAELRREGITDIITLPSLKEGTYTTAGFGSLIVMDRLPHPKATAVYLNWLLSKEGQTVWSKTTGYPSRRVDVTTEGIDPYLILQPGVSYVQNYKEEAIMLKDRLNPFLREIFE